MYNYELGTWTQDGTDDFKEHFETTYYLKYNIEKAMYSLDKIMKSKINYSEFSNRCTYYHFYIDNLLNSIGHIRRRFYNTAIKAERIERNKKEYGYNLTDNDGNKVCNYPIIANNEIRNFIEHIDEKDEKLMELGIYYGSFNVIYKGMNNKIKTDLLNNKRKQNNLLNLISKEYKILTIDQETNSIKEYKLHLVELKKELEKLKNTNETIWKFLTERQF